MLRSTGRPSDDRSRFRPDPCNNALLVELRPILHIHLYPQISKRFHLCFHLGRVNHPERVKPGSLQSESNPSEGQAQIEPAPHRVGVRTGGPFGSPVDIPQIEELPGAEFT